MTTGAHLSKDLYDLIKSIGETRSKQEEDKIITHELRLLKQSINEKNSVKKQKENLIRAIYIEMLGHDASFSQIHAVNLTQNKVLNLKRVGYLACSLFFNQDSDLLILLVSTFQKDMISANIAEVACALNCLSYLLNSNIVNALLDQLLLLLSHKSEIVRKKALCVVQKAYQLSPTLIPDYYDKLKRALCDQDPSVMGVALNMYCEIINKNSLPYKDLMGSFVAILKQVIEHQLNKDYDYHRMPAPWIQIKLLQIIAELGKNDLKISEHAYEIVGQTLRRADDTGVLLSFIINFYFQLNIGYAVTYQCIRTIASLYPNTQLLELAASSVHRFLVSDNNNLKYMGINALILIMQINPKYAIEHQMVVVDCLENNDETLKRETLELLFKMTNATNLEVIVQKLMHYLKMTSDILFKKELLNKVMVLSERFSPNQQWYLTIMNQLFQYASEHISQLQLTNILSLIEENFQQNPTEYGEFLFDLFLHTFNENDTLSENQIKVIAFIFITIKISYILGLLVNLEPNYVIIFDKLNFLKKDVNQSEKLTLLSEKLIQALQLTYEDEQTKGWILNSLAKLTSVPSFANHQNVANALNEYQQSKFVDLSERSNEYNVKKQKIITNCIVSKKILSKYRAFLRQSSAVEVDPDLTFMNNFVEKALKLGAEPDNDDFQLTRSYETTNNSNQQKELKYKSYGQQQLGNQLKKDDDSGLNVTKKVWDPTGFIGKGEEQQQQSVSIAPKQIGIGSDSLKQQQQQFMTMDSQPQKPIEKVDPKLKEQQQLANSLFSGIGGGATQSLFPSQPITKLPTQQQTQSIPKQEPQIDLMDIGVGLGSSGLEDPKYRKCQINLDEFQEEWESLPEEMVKTINMGISNQQGFRNIIERINFAVIEIIGDEVVSAAVNNSGNKVLMFAGVEANGNVEIRIKTKTKQEQNELFTEIMAQI